MRQWNISSKHQFGLVPVFYIPKVFYIFRFTLYELKNLWLHYKWKCFRNCIGVSYFAKFEIDGAYTRQCPPPPFTVHSSHSQFAVSPHSTYTTLLRASFVWFCFDEYLRFTRIMSEAFKVRFEGNYDCHGNRIDHVPFVFIFAAVVHCRRSHSQIHTVTVIKLMYPAVSIQWPRIYGLYGEPFTLYVRKLGIQITFLALVGKYLRAKFIWICWTSVSKARQSRPTNEGSEEEGTSKRRRRSKQTKVKSRQLLNMWKCSNEITIKFLFFQGWFAVDIELGNCIMEQMFDCCMNTAAVCLCRGFFNRMSIGFVHCVCPLAKNVRGMCGIKNIHTNAECSVLVLRNDIATKNKSDTWLPTCFFVSRMQIAGQNSTHEITKHMANNENVMNNLFCGEMWCLILLPISTCVCRTIIHVARGRRTSGPHTPSKIVRSIAHKRVLTHSHLCLPCAIQHVYVFILLAWLRYDVSL